MTFKERWTKEFTRLLTEDEKTAFKLWMEFSKGKISESEFQSKMDIKIMPKLMGKLSAARMNALEDEIESLKNRVVSLEERARKKS